MGRGARAAVARPGRSAARRSRDASGAGSSTACIRGVYAVGHAALRAEGRRLAAVLACGPGAVLSSHRTRGRPLGPAPHRPDAHRRHRPRGRHGAPGIRLHRTRSLDAQDTTNHRGHPDHDGHPHAARCGGRRPAAASSSARSRRPSACGSTTTARSRTSSPDPTGTEERRSWPRRQPRAQMDAQRVGGRVPANCTRRRGTARAAGQRAPSTPPTTATASPTTTGPHTASSSRPTAGRPTAPGRPSRADRAKDAALTASGYRVLRFTQGRRRRTWHQDASAPSLPTAGTRPRSGSPGR